MLYNRPRAGGFVPLIKKVEVEQSSFLLPALSVPEGVLLPLKKGGRKKGFSFPKMGSSPSLNPGEARVKG